MLTVTKYGKLSIPYIGKLIICTICKSRQATTVAKKAQFRNSYRNVALVIALRLISMLNWIQLYLKNIKYCKHFINNVCYPWTLISWDTNQRLFNATASESCIELQIHISFFNVLRIIYTDKPIYQALSLRSINYDSMFYLIFIRKYAKQSGA